MQSESEADCIECRPGYCKHGADCHVRLVGNAREAQCNCRAGWKGRRCEVNQVAQAMGAVLGCFSVAVLAFLAVRLYRRTRIALREARENDALTQGLLQDKEIELKEYNELWEIPEEQIELRSPLADDVQGAQGEVRFRNKAKKDPMSLLAADD